MIQKFGWYWYLSGNEDKLREDKCEKWMYFFTDQGIAQELCQRAIDNKICYECKCTDMEVANTDCIVQFETVTLCNQIFLFAE